MGKRNRAIHVLVMDDEESVAYITRRIFRPYGDRFQVRVAASLTTAKEIMETWMPDVILADYVLPDGRGTLPHHNLISLYSYRPYQGREPPA